MKVHGLMQCAVIYVFHINALEHVKAARCRTLLIQRSGSQLRPGKVHFTGTGRNSA